MQCCLAVPFRPAKAMPHLLWCSLWLVLASPALKDKLSSCHIGRLSYSQAECGSS